MDHGVVTGDWRQHITNNNNNKIIRIIIKELGKETRRKRKNEAGKRGLSSAASCGGFSGRERKKKKGYISIYRKGQKGGRGLGFPHCPVSPPSPGLMAGLSNTLGNQVPIEVIWDLLTGPRRWDRGPRDHVVCWATVSC